MEDNRTFPTYDTALRYYTLRKIVLGLISEGIFPSGAHIQAGLGRDHCGLNTEQTTWRREILTELGWTRGPGLQARWTPPKETP